MGGRVDLRPGNAKKRIILESFKRALQVYFVGSSGDCKWQPGWSEIYPRIPEPDAEPAEKEKARVFLAGRKDLKCGKLKMNPTACKSCPDNPRGSEQKKLDLGALERHGSDLGRTERLHDAVRMGLLALSDLQDLEFEMVRLYWWEIEKQRLSAGVRL